MKRARRSRSLDAVAPVEIGHSTAMSFPGSRCRGERALPSFFRRGRRALCSPVGPGRPGARSEKDWARAGAAAGERDKTGCERCGLMAGSL